MLKVCVEIRDKILCRCADHPRETEGDSPGVYLGDIVLFPEGKDSDKARGEKDTLCGADRPPDIYLSETTLDEPSAQAEWVEGSVQITVGRILFSPLKKHYSLEQRRFYITKVKMQKTAQNHEAMKVSHLVVSILVLRRTNCVPASFGAVR